MINFLKNLKIKWKIFIIFSFILITYIFSVFLSLNQAKEMNYLTDKIILSKNENIILSGIIVESGNLSVNIDKFMSAGYYDLFDKADENISSILEKTSNLKNYLVTSDSIQKVREDLVYLNNLTDNSDVSEINLRKSNIYSNLKIFNVQINNLLSDNSAQMEKLVKEQKVNINEKVNFILLLGMLVLILILVGAYFLNISISKPIIHLERSVSEIIKGNFNVKINLDNNDEIGMLGNSFNKMEVSLKESYSILEEKIKERTSALEKEKGSLENKVKERTAGLERLKSELEKMVAERTEKLNSKVEELERMNSVMMGKELRMVELKKEIEKFKNKSV